MVVFSHKLVLVLTVDFIITVVVLLMELLVDPIITVVPVVVVVVVVVLVVDSSEVPGVTKRNEHIECIPSSSLRPSQQFLEKKAIVEST